MSIGSGHNASSHLTTSLSRIPPRRRNHNAPRDPVSHLHPPLSHENNTQRGRMNDVVRYPPWLLRRWSVVKKKNFVLKIGGVTLFHPVCLLIIGRLWYCFVSPLWCWNVELYDALAPTSRNLQTGCGTPSLPVQCWGVRL